MRIYKLQAAACAIAAALILGICPAMRADDITVPKDTDVPLVFDQEFTSRHAHAGDVLKMHVSDPVIVNGKTVIAAGTPVNGTITKVDKRGHFGVNAKIKLALDSVKSVSGVMIPLEPKGKGEVVGKRTAVAGAASGGGALLLGPVGLVGGYFVVGKPVIIHVGDRLVSQTAADTTIHM